GLSVSLRVIRGLILLALGARERELGRRTNHKQLIKMTAAGFFFPEPLWAVSMGGKRKTLLPLVLSRRTAHVRDDPLFARPLARRAGGGAGLPAQRPAPRRPGAGPPPHPHPAGQHHAARGARAAGTRPSTGG